MGTFPTYEFCYPNCLASPPPHRPIAPLPPPPPHHPFIPPPSPPHISPPPPPHHFPPPSPPHVLPPPPSPPPGHHTIIIIIFVTLGGLFFLAFLSVALCCFIKKRKKVQETGVVRIDEHVKVKEAIVPGPHGPQAVILSIDEDVHIEEELKKDEIVGVHKGSAVDRHHPRAIDLAFENIT